MRFRLSLALIAILALSASPLMAESVKGDKVAARTTTVLSTIDWSHDLDDVMERAQKAKKLVFWMQLVGDLDGGL